LPVANCALAGEEPGVVTVLGDFSGFVKTAVDHLRQLGFRTTALLLLEQGPQARARLVQPFLQGARPADAAKAVLVFAADRNLLWDPHAEVAPVPARLVTWLRALPKPVGVLCPDLGGGGYLIRCCAALRLRVPDEVAVVGSDDTDLSLACEPTLTSIVLSMETIGFEAMRQLAGKMAGAEPPAATIRLKCADLVVRESTGLRRPEICDIAGALECIQTHATRGITVNEVIRQTQRVSRVTFHRRFQEVVGKTPAEAIRERKLQEARRLLSGTELPLGMISDLCGFSSAHILTRLFRGAEGQTPRDYRKSRLQRDLGTTGRPARRTNGRTTRRPIGG
jgi:LacI family transcriptional regulator